MPFEHRKIAGWCLKQADNEPFSGQAAGTMDTSDWLAKGVTSKIICAIADSPLPDGGLPPDSLRLYMTAWQRARSEA